MIVRIAANSARDRAAAATGTLALADAALGADHLVHGGHQVQHRVIDPLVVGQEGPTTLTCRLPSPTCPKMTTVASGADVATTWRTSTANSARRDWGRNHVQLVGNAEAGNGLRVPLVQANR